MATLDLTPRGSSGSGGGGLTAAEVSAMIAQALTDYVPADEYRADKLESTANISINNFFANLAGFSITRTGYRVRGARVESPEGKRVFVQETFANDGIQLYRETGDFEGCSIFATLERIA